jgi:hypothetical protein
MNRDKEWAICFVTVAFCHIIVHLQVMDFSMSTIL